MNKTRVLFFIKLPPPITGATLINNFANSSKLLNINFNIRTISVSFKKKLNEKNILKKIVKTIFYQIKLIKELYLFKPTIVYFQLSPLGLAFWRDCTYIFWIKLFKVHIVYHLHGKGIMKASTGSKVLEYLYKWAFKNSSIICLSNLLEYDVASVYEGRPYIVNNGIPYIANSIKSESKSKVKINILFLSNMFYSKGIITFLDSLTKLENEYTSEINVNVVGNEADLTVKGLDIEIKKRNLSDLVNYLGSKYDTEKYLILNDSDILVYPTHEDTWPLVILEAMQFGVPVIASREGAIPEIVDDGITGFLVDKNRPDQIAEKLKVLMSNHDLRHRMGLAAKEKFLKKYTLEIFENNMLHTFNQIVKGLR